MFGMSTEFKLIVLGVLALVIAGLSVTVVILKKDINALDLKLEACENTVTVQKSQIAQEKSAVAACQENYQTGQVISQQSEKNKEKIETIYKTDCSTCPSIPSGKEMTEDEKIIFKSCLAVDWKAAIAVNNSLVDQFLSGMQSQTGSASAKH